MRGKGAVTSHVNNYKFQTTIDCISFQEKRLQIVIRFFHKNNNSNINNGTKYFSKKGPFLGFLFEVICFRLQVPDGDKQRLSQHSDFRGQIAVFRMMMKLEQLSAV